MVNCPECGKPLRKEGEDNIKYFCENERCNVIFVAHPCEPTKARVAYTGFARYKTARLTQNKPYGHPMRQKHQLF